MMWPSSLRAALVGGIPSPGASKCRRALQPLLAQRHCSRLLLPRALHPAVPFLRAPSVAAPLPAVAVAALVLIAGLQSPVPPAPPHVFPGRLKEPQAQQDPPHHFLTPRPCLQSLQTVGGLVSQRAARTRWCRKHLLQQQHIRVSAHPTLSLTLARVVPTCSGQQRTCPVLPSPSLSQPCCCSLCTLGLVQLTILACLHAKLTCAARTNRIMAACWACAMVHLDPFVDTQRVKPVSARQNPPACTQHMRWRHQQESDLCNLCESNVPQQGRQRSSSQQAGDRQGPQQHYHSSWVSVSKQIAQGSPSAGGIDVVGKLATI